MKELTVNYRRGYVATLRLMMVYMRKFGNLKGSGLRMINEKERNE